MRNNAEDQLHSSFLMHQLLLSLRNRYDLPTLSWADYQPTKGRLKKKTEMRTQ